MRVVAAVIVLIAVPAAAAAGVADRVQVGQPGRNTTRAFSPSTHVLVQAPGRYVATAFDGDSGSWRGPLCVVGSNRSLSKDATVAWAVTFSNRFRSADEAAAAARTFDDLPVASRLELEVPHVVRGRTVGTIRAVAVVGASRSEHGWHELGLGLPLTRGVFAGVRFWSTGPSFRCAVDDVPSEVWHRETVHAAANSLVVDGNLPVARITAAGAKGLVRGRVVDGFGHAVVGVPVVVERKDGRRWRRAGRAITDGTGAYRAKAASGLVRARVGAAVSGPTRAR
jgi:hypothetical protein